MKTINQIRKKFRIEQIWREHHEELRQYIESRIADRSDADDILQELFMELYTRPVLNNEENERISLYRITRKVILSYYCDNFDIEQELLKLGELDSTSSKKQMPVATGILMPLYQPAWHHP
jgi:DNA-directed RNA polymerase specialized sigma24 family protein